MMCRTWRPNLKTVNVTFLKRLREPISTRKQRKTLSVSAILCQRNCLRARRVLNKSRSSFLHTPVISVRRTVISSSIQHKITQVHRWTSLQLLKFYKATDTRLRLPLTLYLLLNSHQTHLPFHRRQPQSNLLPLENLPTLLLFIKT